MHDKGIFILKSTINFERYMDYTKPFSYLKWIINVDKRILVHELETHGTINIYLSIAEK